MGRESGRWSAVSSGFLRSDLHNGLVAVLNPLSWETHILDGWSVRVLERVPEASISFDDLRARIRGDFGVPADSEAGPDNDVDDGPDGPAAPRQPQGLRASNESKVSHRSMAFDGPTSPEEDGASLDDRLRQTLARLESVHLIRRVPRFAEAP